MANKPVLSSQQQSAFNDALLSGIHDKDMNVIRLALDNGAEPNLLMFAGMDYKPTWKDAFNAEAGNKGFAYEWVKMAVEAGADTKATKLGGDKKGWAAMHWAYLNFNSDIIDYLVEKGESIDTPSPYNDTPLMRAVDEGKADQVRYFLGKGADPMAVCGEKKDSFPLQALQKSGKFKKGVQKELLTLMMQKAKVRAEETAAAAETPKPESAVALPHAIEISAPLEFKHAAPEKTGKSFSL